MIAADDKQHFQKVEVRRSTLESDMEKKFEGFLFDRAPEYRLLIQATKAKGKAKRIFWLRQAAHVATAVVSEYAACRAGCSHCCNIAVTIPKSEAELIASEIGRTINKNAGRFYGDSSRELNDEVNRSVYGKPCPFLDDGKCSIYENRPLACRLQLNMDVDDLLCKLVAEDAPSVPYLDLRHHSVAAAQTLGECFDDIRAWFGEEFRNSES